MSTKGRYGVKALFELALHYGEGPVSLKSVAESQGLSEHYLEQLVSPLRRAGLVKSVRGAQGGYELARNPEKITVGDIIRVLEGPIVPTECALDGQVKVEHCGNPDHCMARGVWARIRDSVVDVVDSITLADLCEEYRAADDKSKFMFYI